MLPAGGRNTSHHLSRHDDVDSLWLNFKACILAAAEASIPRIAPARKVNCVPITGAIRRAFLIHKRVYPTVRGSSTLAQELRTQADGKLSRAILDSRKTFESKVADDCKRNPKRDLW